MIEDGLQGPQRSHVEAFNFAWLVCCHVGHVMRRQELENLSLTGKIEGKRQRSRPRQKYMDGIVRATGGRMTATQLLHLAYKKDEWRAMVANVPDDTALRYGTVRDRCPEGFATS